MELHGYLVFIGMGYARILSRFRDLRCSQFGWLVKIQSQRQGDVRGPGQHLELAGLERSDQFGPAQYEQGLFFQVARDGFRHLAGPAGQVQIAHRDPAVGIDLVPAQVNPIAGAS